jgi:MFS family permease
VVDRTLVGLSLYSLLSSNRSGVFLVFFPVFLVEVDHAPVPITLAITSVAYVAGSLVQPLAGRWSDQIGRRRPFLIGAELGALPLYLSIPFVPGYPAAGLAFIAGTTVLSMGGPALNAYVADVTRDRSRGGAYGLLNAASSGGGIAGFVIVGLLVLDLGFHFLFYFVALVQVGTLGILLIRVPDDRTVGTPARRPLSEMKEVAYFSTTVSIRSLGAGAVGAFYGIYAGALGANLFEVSLVAIAGLATMALTALPVGRLVDSIGEIRGLLWGTGVSIVGIVAFLVATNWAELLPAQGFRNLGFAFLSPAMLSWVARLAPPGRRAEYLGLFSLINSTLWSLGPLAGSAAFSLAGPAGLFGFSIGATALSLVAIEGFYVRGRRGRRATPIAAEPVPTSGSAGSGSG